MKVKDLIQKLKGYDPEMLVGVTIANNAEKYSVLGGDIPLEVMDQVYRGLMIRVNGDGDKKFVDAFEGVTDEQ